jgi:GcrA cell cycle regulator
MSNAQTTPWAPAEITTLRTLHKAGLSASRIAAQIGGKSRNAVIGKLHRLGLCRVRPPEDQDDEREKVRPERPKRPTPSLPAISGGYRPRRLISVLPPPPLSAEKIGVYELTSTTCRWPIGDPHAEDFRFCGAMPRDGEYLGAAGGGSPYCDYHYRRSVRQSI